ncbi:hypothetical protein [Paracoccus sp. (in: a-proteobacteria)]|uniref:hypothetical protein n=1 Tax=Paracoccus sp. TaxID=267 RepID=UPI0035B4CADC
MKRIKSVLASGLVAVAALATLGLGAMVATAALVIALAARLSARPTQDVPDIPHSAVVVEGSPAPAA